ncbi:complement C3 alpha chain-like [Saimiri boliviensis]|uniref:complement C3 alpha chain-like n=1 Tax=Saimiri boliviensis TaxID=27679 RepID=UPI003D77F5A4
MTIMEVSLLTGFYPNQDDLKQGWGPWRLSAPSSVCPLPQLTSDVERYSFQHETKTSTSDSTIVLYLEKLSHEKNTVLGFRVHRMLQVEFLQAALITVYDYYEPSWGCSTFYNLPTEQSSLQKICHKDVCRCAEGQCPSLRKPSVQLRQEELQVAACETGVDFEYKTKLESVKVSASNPYVYYNMQLEDIIKSGVSQVTKAESQCGVMLEVHPGGPSVREGPTSACTHTGHGPCHTSQHEEICLPRHLPRLPGVARTGIVPHHGPDIRPVKNQIWEGVTRQL